MSAHPRRGFAVAYIGARGYRKVLCDGIETEREAHGVMERWRDALAGVSFGARLSHTDGFEVRQGGVFILPPDAG